MKLKFTFVVPVNDMIVAENNILASPLFSILEGKEILIQKNYSSASRAYNDAIDKAKSDIIIFVHQDIILPMKWSDELIQCLTLLESEDPNWGVLGCYGETEQGEGRGYLYCAGNNSYIGKYSRMPHKVQTLDEIILIIRKSSGLKFDESLPHFHLYGTDICMEARKRGKSSYAMSAFCFHNSKKTVIFPSEFFCCCEFIRKKWLNELPIHTSCVTITKSRYMFYLRYRLFRPIKYFAYEHFNTRVINGKRIDNPLEYMNKINAMRD